MTFRGLEVLFEEQDLPHGEMPSRIRDLYGGPIGFDPPITYANFVTSLDGVVALPEVKDSPAVISGKSEADRFVMGLLRALADCIVIGAATMRNAVQHLWTSDYIYPDLSDDWEALRRALKKSSSPSLVVVTSRGNLPLDHPALQRGAIILTNEQTAGKLSHELPDTCRVEVLASGSRMKPSRLREFVHSEGFESVLTEAGPSLFTQLLGEGLVDELFLTRSPLVAGSSQGSRPGIVDGLELLPDKVNSSRLLSVRRSESYLFLRYRLEK